MLITAKNQVCTLKLNIKLEVTQWSVYLRNGTLKSAHCQLLASCDQQVRASEVCRLTLHCTSTAAGVHSGSFICEA